MVDQIRTAPMLIAASKCWLSRPEPPERGGPIRRLIQQHREPCRFCDFGTDYLRMLLEEANAWVAFNNRAPLVDFERLSPGEQRRQVRAAAQVPDALSTISD